MVSVSLSGFALCCVAVMVTSPFLTEAAVEVPLTATPSNNSGRAGGVNVASPPSILPIGLSGRCVPGPIQVKFIGVEPNSVIHFVIDRDGLRQPLNDKSPSYSERAQDVLKLSVEGTHIVRAFALPNNPAIEPSATIEKVFCVKAPSFPPPKIDPTPCISKGPLQFTVSMPGVAADDMKKNYNVKYVLNHNTDPDAPWVEYDYHPILLSEPGKHSIDLQATMTDISDPRKGDVSSSWFQCVIEDPIVYDITTASCPKCNGKPTVGQPFALWVQNVDHESSMFLTTQSNGCETQKHLVDGTSIRNKITLKPMVTFVPKGVGTSVYVCLRDGPNGAYKLIPRRSGLDRFELQGAAGGMTPMPDSADGGSPGQQPDFDQQFGPVTFAPVAPATNFGTALILLMIVVLGVMVVKTLRR